MSISTFLIFTFSIALINCQIINDVPTAFNVELQSAFPANAFNSSCVSSSCPNLNSPNVCSTSSYDLNATLTVIRECAKGSTVCGLQIEPRPIRFTQFSVNPLLKGIPLSGYCNSTPNCIYTNVVPTFTVISKNKVVMSLPNLTFYGNITCSMSQSVTSNLPVGIPVPPLPTVNVAYNYNVNYSSTLDINNDNSVKVNNPTFVVTGVNFNGLKFPSFPGFPDYLSTFKVLMGAALGNSSLPSNVGNFYQNLVQSALEVAADK